MTIGMRLTSGTNFTRATSKTFEVIAGWVETLHGQGDFRQIVGALAELVDADVVTVTRTLRQSGATRTVAVVDSQAGKMFSNRTPQAFGAEMIADAGLPGRHGSVWVLSEMLLEGVLDPAHRLADSLEDRGIRDIAVIPLDSHRDTDDYIEFHFRSEFAEHNQVLLATLAPALMKSWKARLPGTVEKLIASTRVRRATPVVEAVSVDILDVSNPAGLSRSEYRICTLIREGMLFKQIAEELDIRTSTMRSHLRSIYAKTGTSCHVELLHHLAGTAEANARQSRLSA